VQSLLKVKMVTRVMSIKVEELLAPLQCCSDGGLGSDLTPFVITIFESVCSFLVCYKKPARL